MSLAQAERVARALLYEGYALYPYRPSALKNQFRWTFGTLYPPAFAARAGERCALHGECIVQGAAARLLVQLRFLQPALRAGAAYDSWQEAIERSVALPECGVLPLLEQPLRHEVVLPEGEEDGEAGTLRHLPLAARLEVRAERASADAVRLSLRVENRGMAGVALEPQRARAALSALASTHLLLQVRAGAFVSAIDPPKELLGPVRDCRNDGVWPALLGDPARRDTLLLSPIIVNDYPEVAKESPGDFFDATEIDAMLALRLQTLTEAEKRELRRSDPRAQALLERAETLPPERMRELHGAWRPVSHAPGADWSAGDRVLLKPRAGRDAFDIMLRGELATVVGIERDLEGNIHCAVTIDRDPGRDLGAQGAVGHRFYFAPDELERLP